MAGRYSNSSRGLSEDEVSNIEGTGRRVLYDSWRNPIITSRRGAPASPQDADVSNLTGITNPTNTDTGFNSPEHKAGWGSFFKQHAPPKAGLPSLAPQPDAIGADTAFGGGTTSYGTPVIGNPVAASITQNSQWLGQNGIAFPPPPTPRSSLFPTGTNPMTFPNSDSAQFKSGFVGPNGVNPGYANRVGAYNADLYKPADTVQDQRQKPQFPTGWQTTTPGQTASIGNQYSSMSNWLKQKPING